MGELSGKDTAGMPNSPQHSPSPMAGSCWASSGLHRAHVLFRTLRAPFLPSHGSLPTLAYFYHVPLKGCREGKGWFVCFQFLTLIKKTKTNPSAKLIPKWGLPPARFGLWSETHHHTASWAECNASAPSCQPYCSGHRWPRCGSQGKCQGGQPTPATSIEPQCLPEILPRGIVEPTIFPPLKAQHSCCGQRDRAGKGMTA